MNARISRLTLAAVSACAAMSSQALAQNADHPFFDPARAGSLPPPRMDIGKGKVFLQTRAQQNRAYAATHRSLGAINTALDNPTKTDVRDLRTGESDGMVVCGVVDSQTQAGERQSHRFIARTNIATLETEANKAAFRAGWKLTGCGI
jgi:hypothetical protein